MITTTSEFRSHCPSWPGAIGALGGADDAAEGRERRADDERDREGELDVDAERRGHLAVVDACADDHARARAVEPDPEPEPDSEAEEEHHEARERVVDPEQRQLRRAGSSSRATSRSTAMPSLKCAITWSAMMIEIAIVISAWRSSWPWFQRRKTCWTIRPTSTDHRRRDERRKHPLPRGHVGARRS